MISILGAIQLGSWELGQISQSVTARGLAQPKRFVTLWPVFSSMLGTIELGCFELGNTLILRLVSSLDCAGVAHPTRDATYLGGAPRVFSAVLGTIELGKFELGQVPSVVKPPGFALFGAAHPIRNIRLGPVSVECTGSAYPVRSATPNLGDLVCVGKGHPTRSVSYAFYYPSLPASGAAEPTRTATYVLKNSAAGAANPRRRLFPISGQKEDCLVGPNPPEGGGQEIGNFTY